MISRDHIGRTSPPVTLDVERGHIRRFCEAIGENDPIYFDEQAARAAGHPAIPAPPTFAAALRPNDARAGMALDWKKILHGEQEFHYRRPLYAGDRLTLVQRIADIYEKSGKAGAMDLLVLETEARDAREELVFTARATIVVKR
jgi:acyl dehydratase